MSQINIDSFPSSFRQFYSSFDVYDEFESEDSDPIPAIDLQTLNQEKVGEICKNWGIFRLVNHGIPLALLTQFEEYTKGLFSLKFDEKQGLFTSPFSYFWGTPALSPSGNALSRGTQNINWVEGFNVPLSQLSEFQDQGDSMLYSFRHILGEYGKHMGRIGRTIFEAMAKNLNLDANETNSKFSEATGLVRLYRYPPSGSNEKEGENGCGMEVHTDSSLLSILNQNQVGGLQFLKDEKWIRVVPISNTLIINLGDMMQAISDDEYTSVKHRVKMNKCKDRISMCYFVFPSEGSVIQSSKYKPFTYSDFQAQVQHDIKTLGFKVGLERFKLPQQHH